MENVAVYHPVKIVVGIVATAFFFREWLLFFLSKLIWMGVGAAGMLVFQMWRLPKRSQEDQVSSTVTSEELIMNETVEQNGSSNGHTSEIKGWMLLLSSNGGGGYPKYNPFTFHLKNTQPVFIQLNGPNLLLSHPDPQQHSIPKRRYWTDKQQVSHEQITFNRQQQFNLYRARVEIAPTGLSRSRIWNKKYPIAIKFSPGGTMSECCWDSFGEPTFKEEKCDGKSIFLFARTDREKDDWFRQFIFLSKRETAQSLAFHKEIFYQRVNFWTGIKRACPTVHISDPDQQSKLDETVPMPKGKAPQDASRILPGELIAPGLKALPIRLLLHVLNSTMWKEDLVLHIDRKLEVLRKSLQSPVIESLKVTRLHLGDHLPKITSATDPVLDCQGLWVDLDFCFESSVEVTVEAKVNLNNVGKLAGGGRRDYAIFESDEEVSGEEEEGDEHSGIFREWVNGIKKSPIWNNFLVQWVIGSIRETSFAIALDIRRVEGTVVVNIPPEPNDRIWIGLRGKPEVDFESTGLVEWKDIPVPLLNDFMKEKLEELLQSALDYIICPNMLDIRIPLFEFQLPK